MRHAIALLLALGAVLQAASAAEAPITKVILYPGSATVERTAQISMGMTQLEVSGLPANFSTDTIRVQSDAGIQIGQVVTQDRRQATSPGTHEAELESRIQALQDEIDVLGVDAKSAQLVQAYLERLGNAGSSEHAAPMDLKNMAATLGAIRKGGSDALMRVHVADIKRRALDKQMRALKSELEKVKSGTHDGRTITISFVAHRAGAITIDYQVDGAGWRPVYRASLNSNTSVVDLERQATIFQKTGEDWSHVKMLLSTGQPRLAPGAPDSSPWLLRYSPPVDINQALSRIVTARRSAASAPGRESVVEAISAEDIGKLPDESQSQMLALITTFATEFDVPAFVTLPADGRQISIELASVSLPVKQFVQVKPRLDTAAFVVASTVRPAGVWLPGQVQLFRDGSYVGHARWDTQSANEITFPFGVDPLVHVDVEHRKNNSGEQGFLTREKERRIDDTYVVTSRHQKPLQLLVLEATPVSESDKITVKMDLKPAPSIKDWQGRRGVVGWERTLAPNETARFELNYDIAYPQEGFVSGL